VALRELERIAYSNIRDVIQWDAEPIFDDDGNVTGERPVLKVTPSHLFTRELLGGPRKTGEHLPPPLHERIFDAGGTLFGEAYAFRPITTDAFAIFFLEDLQTEIVDRGKGPLIRSDRSRDCRS
jgi:hypothetical protein